MKQKSTISSASGNIFPQQSSKNTGRTGYFTATSPTLLPTPNALDYINPRSLEALRRAKKKGGCRNMKDLISHPQEYGVDLLPTPTARDIRVVSPNQKPRDDLTCAVELGATKTKRSLYSQAASPASHSAMQDEEKARQMTATSGQTCFESYKTSSQTGSSLKMCVGLLLGTKGWYSSRCALTWKAKATKSNRLLFQLVPSTLRTAGTGSGLLPTVQTQGLKVCKNGKSIPMTLPTPVASDYEGGVCKDARIENGRWLRTNAKGQKFGVKVRDAVGATGAKTGEKLRLQPAMPEWMMGFPEKWTEFPIVSPSGGTNQSKPTATQ